ncbi:MAG: PilN domain-containing protein, partial [Methyloligellaceae bacterium]
VVLEALSKALPDHSYLKKLEVRGQEVKLSGISTDAAALITRLEASPRFAKVSFSAPTTRQPGSDRETFAIVARLEKGNDVGASK